MGESVLVVAFFPSERLTELTGSRHSLSRCWECSALPCFSSLVRAWTLLNTWGEGWPQETPHTGQCDHPCSARLCIPALGAALQLCQSVLC